MIGSLLCLFDVTFTVTDHLTESSSIYLISNILNQQNSENGNTPVDVTGDSESEFIFEPADQTSEIMQTKVL